MRKRLLTLLTLLAITVIGSAFVLEQQQRQHLQAMLKAATLPPTMSSLLPSAQQRDSHSAAVLAIPSTPIYVEPIAIEPPANRKPLILTLPENIEHLLDDVLSPTERYRLHNLFNPTEQPKSLTISPGIIIDEQEEDLINSIDGAMINFEFSTD